MNILTISQSNFTSSFWEENVWNFSQSECIIGPDSHVVIEDPTVIVMIWFMVFSATFNSVLIGWNFQRSLETTIKNGKLSMAAMFDFYQIKQDRIRHVLQKTPHKPFRKALFQLNQKFLRKSSNCEMLGAILVSEVTTLLEPKKCMKDCSFICMR
jgi:hypothetical protein